MWKDKEDFWINYGHLRKSKNWLSIHKDLMHEGENRHSRRMLNREPNMKQYIARNGLSTFDETSVKPHDIGHMIYTCSECGALMFKDEKSDKQVSK